MKLNKSVQNVNKYLANQTNLDTVNFITCGSVDDGKSTLIGRLLFESKKVFEDQIAHLKNEQKKIGIEHENIDFAYLLDGLTAEREQGITIDVAYRYFSTDKRKFIVADTPGHKEYTRNMVTGASNADVAIILIDARKGLLEQTRRHTMICSILGIKKIIIAINKMDLVNYSSKIFKDIEHQFRQFAENLVFELILVIPISALKGENIIQSSENLNWFKGPTLISFLENVNIKEENKTKNFCFPVQWVNRPNMNFRGYSGTIISGTAKVGKKVFIYPSLEEAYIKKIIFSNHRFAMCDAGKAVTIQLDRELDVSRGDIITDDISPPEISDHFQITLVWMDKEPGYAGRTYILKLGTMAINAQITEIKNRINIETFERVSSKKIEINDISTITLKTEKKITFKKYNDCRTLGGLILIDRMSNQTVAAGMISFGLRRSSNIYKYSMDINKESRQQLNGHISKVIWFTGLSGSGKSTIANALEKELHNQRYRTYILDGDNVRNGLNKDLGFTDADRVENIRRISEVSKLMVDAGIIVITSFISPFRAEREMARKMFTDDEFIEVFVDTPMDIIESRDPKGLYKKARRGELPNFTGIDSPYESPRSPEVRVSTEKDDVNKIVKIIMSKLNI